MSVLCRKLAGEAAHIKSLEGLLVDACRERDEARAEVEMLRGVGCREAKEGEPESGPCGVCLKCAEERGAKWALDAALDKADLADTTNEAFYGVKGLRAEEICADARRPSVLRGDE